MKLYKYHGAGNDFLLLDGRESPVELSPERVAALCDRHTGIGSDGLMVLSESSGSDFKMDFYNPDGSGGMMCGNGGRCIVAFARDLGIQPSEGGRYVFEAPDGTHWAEVLSDEGRVKTIRLGMKDVVDCHPVALSHPISSAHASSVFPGQSPSVIPGQAPSVIPGRVPGISRGWFIDTGTRHFVTFVSSVERLKVEKVGRTIRRLPQFGPVGVNVNFVEILSPTEIAVRTFEKGVEAETLSCGTGITASAIAASIETGSSASAVTGTGLETILVHARRHDLTVSFRPFTSLPVTGLTLTGPAERVAAICI